MPALAKSLLRPALIAATLFFASLLYYGHAALNFPTLFNLDNVENFAATRYIFQHGKIPVVKEGDKEIFFSEIGTTRSLRPPFTFIVSAIAAKLAEDSVDDPIALQRLGSPIIAAITVVVFFLGFYLAFNHLGLALAGSTVIALLPKFVFLASSNNDDIGAILSVSLLFACVIALIKHRHKTWLLVALALSFGLILQTKYTAWLTLPWFGLFCIALLIPLRLKMVKLMPLLLPVFILAGGWWVIFNMVNYGVDDPTALNYASQLQSSLSEIEPNRQGYASEGVGLIDLLSGHDDFLSKSFKSLIGYLQWLELEVGAGMYLFYASIFFIGLAGVLFRSRASHEKVAYLDFLVVALILGQCVFYLHHNLVRDIQPQARYILPIVMPLMYLFLRVVEQVPSSALILSVKTRQFGFQDILSTILIAVCFILYLGTLSNYIRPSFIPTPFYTSLSKPQKINIQTDLNIASATSLSYQFTEDKLALSKNGHGKPTLLLTSEFCELLPLNAIITVNVTSSTKGSLELRLDKSNQGIYEKIFWRSFPSGRSLVVFSVNSNQCTGAKITLGKGTHQITLDDLRIVGLRIHQHGKPI